MKSWQTENDQVEANEQGGFHWYRRPGRRGLSEEGVDEKGNKRGGVDEADDERVRPVTSDYDQGLFTRQCVHTEEN